LAEFRPIFGVEILLCGFAHFWAKFDQNGRNEITVYKSAYWAVQIHIAYGLLIPTLKYLTHRKLKSFALERPKYILRVLEIEEKIGYDKRILYKVKCCYLFEQCILVRWGTNDMLRCPK
jgi:hypothetical protein